MHGKIFDIFYIDRISKAYIINFKIKDVDREQVGTGSDLQKAAG